MVRLLSTLLVLGLLGGTAAAFGITERLKLVRSPIFATRVDKVFSPVCECDTDAATIAFTLRRRDDVTVEIVRGDDVVRTLGRRNRARGRLEFSWDGRDDAGGVLPEASYRPRVRLAEEHRTIVLPNPIRIDTTPPTLSAVRVAPAVISPDEDGRSDKAAVRYRVDEPARLLMFVDGRRTLRSRSKRMTAKVDVYATSLSRRARPATYDVRFAAQDVAGNVSPFVARTIRIRYVELARPRLRVRAGARFGIGVDTDAVRYRWRLAGRSGTARARLLVLRAPVEPGTYTLFVSANGYADRATVRVTPRDR